MKPEDISQEAWDAAARCVPPYVSSKIIADIARAILAAEKRGEEREREACAQVADKQGLWHISASHMSLPVEPSPIIAKDRAKVAFVIRDAISNRSQS